jgi:hypothetical protein
MEEHRDETGKNAEPVGGLACGNVGRCCRGVTGDHEDRREELTEDRDDHEEKVKRAGLSRGNPG